MKRIIFYALSLVLMLHFASCGETPDPGPVEQPEIQLQSEQKVTLNPEGDDVVVSFYSAMSWTAELSSVSDASKWMTLSKTSGSKGDFSINVVAEANHTGKKRTASLDIISEGITRSVVFTQESTDLEAKNTTKTIGCEGGTINWDIKYSGEYGVDIDVDWISHVDTKSLESARLVFEVDVNDGEARTGTVTLSGSDKEFVLTVSQDACEEEESVFRLVSNNAGVSADGGIVKVVVETNVDYEYEILDDWVNEAGTKVIEEKVHEFEVEPNPTDEERIATITFCAGTKCTPFTITQEAGEQEQYLEVDKLELTVDADDTQAYIITVESNVEWTVRSSKSSWCKVDPSEGTGNGTFEIILTENAGSERKAVVTVSSGSLSCKINVTQKAVAEPEPEEPYLEVGMSELTVEADDVSKYVISVKSNADWSVSSNKAWCEVDPSYGTGEGVFNIVCTENTSYSERYAVVTVTSGDISSKINVTQKAAEEPEGYLELTATYLEFSAESSKKSISLDSNEEWTVESDAWWCTVDPERGNGDADVTIYVEENESVNPRNAKLVFRSESCEEIVNIMQGGKEEPEVDPVLEVSSPGYTLFGNTALDIEVEITSNVDWTAFSDVTWCTISPSSGNGDGLIMISVKENKTSKVRNAIITVKSSTITRQIIIVQPGTSGTEGFEEDDELDWDNF